MESAGVYVPVGPPVGPIPFSPPDNDGQFLFMALIPDGTVSQFLSRTVNAIEIGPTATPQTDNGVTTALLTISNNGKLRMGSR